VCQQFLAGANAMDNHFLENANSERMANNLPLLLGLFGAYNVTGIDLPNRAVLPYF
jgi:glucose-6-phosphate isomerase